MGWGAPGGATLALLLAVAFVVLAVLGSRPLLRSGPRKALLIALRWLSALCAFALAAQPTFWSERIRTEPGSLAVVVDGSRSMGVSTGDATRMERAKQLVTRWAKSARGAEARFYVLGEGLEPKERAQLEASLRARAPGSPIVSTVRELAEQRDLGAIVLVTDGADTAGATVPKALATRVHGVLVGDDRPLRDDAIARVQPDAVAFLHGEAKVHATISSVGLGERTLTVSLKRGTRTLDTQEITVKEGGRTQVELGFTPSDLGREVYSLELGMDADDDVPENNQRPFVVRVKRDRLRVLHVSGRPSWDQRFLRGFLKRDPSIDLISFFILRSVHDLTMSSPSELALIPFPTDELFRQHLTSFDLVILQDFDYEPYQMAPYLPLIRDYVRQGGGLAMIGGSLSFDGGGYAETALAEVLPVRMRSADPSGAAVVEGSFAPEPVPALLHHPLLELYPEPAQTLAAFRQLDPFQGANALLGVRAGGVALLEHPTARGDDGAKLPVLTVGRFDRGRSLALGTDTSWHWSMPTAGRGGDPSAYDRFWDRAVRWLTRDPLLDPSSLSTDHDTYTPGARIQLSGFARDESYRAIARANVTIELRDANDKLTSSTTTETDDQGSLRATLTAPEQPGIMHAVLMHDGRELARLPLVLELSGDELSDPAPDPKLVEGLAQRTGGKYFASPEKAPGLDELDASRSTSLGIERHAPFSNPFWAALTFAALALEWILRRRWGEV